MPATDELSAHATSSIDFYALLSLQPTATDPQIRSAFRKTSLKYHPDKVGATPENVEKFLLVKTAHDILSDPKIRALYDQTREAKEREKAETEKLDAGRRKMVNDLMRREHGARNAGVTGIMGVKRNRSGEEESPEQKLERELRRIGEENRRKKEEMMETRERERLEEEDRLADEKEARERLRKAKEREGLKDQKTEVKFTFLKTADQVGGSSGVLLDQSPKNGSTFEQTILEKMKMAQREKDRKRRLEAENLDMPSQETGIAD